MKNNSIAILILALMAFIGVYYFIDNNNISNYKIFKGSDSINSVVNPPKKFVLKNKIKTTLIDEGIVGKVKSIIETEYFAKEKFGEFIKDLKPSSIEERMFDSNGQEVESKRITLNFDTLIYIYKYDNSGYLIDMTTYQNNGEIVSKVTYEPSETGEWRYGKLYESKDLGKLSAYIKERYNEKGELEEKIYDEPNFKSWKRTINFTYEYGDHGNKMKKHEKFTKNGNLEENSHTEFNYDDKGRVIVMFYNYQRAYEYYYENWDFNGNWQKSIQKDLGDHTYTLAQHRIIEREIEYY